jgi:hypothetical protein
MKKRKIDMEAVKQKRAKTKSTANGDDFVGPIPHSDMSAYPTFQPLQNAPAPGQYYPSPYLFYAQPSSQLESSGNQLANGSASTGSLLTSPFAFSTGAFGQHALPGNQSTESNLNASQYILWPMPMVPPAPVPSACTTGGVESVKDKSRAVAEEATKDDSSSPMKRHEMQ